MESDQPPQGSKKSLSHTYRDSVLFRKLRNKSLHVGVLGNIYTSSGNAFVEADLSSVTQNIAQALRALGFQVTIFDMNLRDDAIVQLVDSDIDFVFNVCERINDNSLLEPHAAALLDILQIPYTGSNPQTLALSIDKIRVKKLLSYHGVPTPRFDYFYSMDDEMEEKLRFPLIVKPANTDNSIGITNDSVVTNKKQLKKQMEKVILEHRRPALVEEYIEGDEIDISIMGSDNDHNLQVLPLTRSIFDDMPPGIWRIFPFEAKWGENPDDYNGPYEKVQVERPAKLPKRLTKYLSEIATHTYNILDCHDYGRVEARIDSDGKPYILELNPNPSINRGDCVPNCAAVDGLDYNEFIYKVLELAVIRYTRNPPLFSSPGARSRYKTSR